MLQARRQFHFATYRVRLDLGPLLGGETKTASISALGIDHWAWLQHIGAPVSRSVNRLADTDGLHPTLISLVMHPAGTRY